MPTPTQLTNGSKCVQVSFADHLASSGQEEDGSGVATEVVIVKWSGPATPADCEGASDGAHVVPTRGVPHRIIPARVAKRTQAKAIGEDTRSAYQVRIDYSDQADPLTDPLDDPPEITWDFSDSGQEPYFLDNNPAGAKPVLNTAGEPFSDYLQRETGEIVATFSRNVSATAFATLLQLGVTYTNFQPSANAAPCPVVNSDAFHLDTLAIAAGQARFGGVGLGAVQVQNGVKFRVFKVTLKLRAAWLDVIDSRGFNEKENISIAYQSNTGLTTETVSLGLREIIKGEPPVKCDHPWPLDTSGRAMPNVTDTPAQLTFHPYPAKPFAAFNFA